MVEASCFQASRVGVEGTETGLGAGPSREDPVTMVPGGAGGDEGAKGGLVSAAEVGKEASVVPFAVPPSVRKWKFACLMAPSRVLKSAPHSSTTQWKWAL